MDQPEYEISPEDARLTLLQFLGQTSGELKEVNSMIVSPSSTLNAANLNVEQIIKEIPASATRPPVSPSPSKITATPLPVQFTGTIKQPAPLQVESNSTEPQLELNFTYDIVKDVIDRLERIERFLNLVLRNQDDNIKPHSEAKLPLKKT